MSGHPTERYSQASSYLICKMKKGTKMGDSEKKENDRMPFGSLFVRHGKELALWALGDYPL